MHVMVPSVDDLNDFVMHRLMRLKGVRDVHTQLVLQNIKGPSRTSAWAFAPPAIVDRRPIDVRTYILARQLRWLAENLV